jgi:hypothetical protein
MDKHDFMVFFGLIIGVMASKEGKFPNAKKYKPTLIC